MRILNHAVTWSLCTVLISATPGYAKSSYAGGHVGFYSGIGMQYSLAQQEEDLPQYYPEYITISSQKNDATTKGIGKINGSVGAHFNEGYRFSILPRK